MLYDRDTLTAQSKSRVNMVGGAAQPCKPRMVLWSTGTLPIHMVAIKIVTSCSGTQCHPSSLYAKHATPNETPHFWCSLSCCSRTSPPVCGIVFQCVEVDLVVHTVDAVSVKLELLFQRSFESPIPAEPAATRGLVRPGENVFELI
jgi:hypothetical protein